MEKKKFHRIFIPNIILKNQHNFYGHCSRKIGTCQKKKGVKFEVVLRENRKRRIKYLKSIDKVSWIFDHIDFNYAFVHLFGRTKCNGYRFRHQNQTFEPSKRKGKKKYIYIYIYIYGEVRLSMLNALRQVDNTKFI